MFDLKIIDGLVILESLEIVTEIGVKDGVIVAIGHNLGEADKTLDAKGLVVSQGMVDAHVHITDPGGTYRDGWEGYLTGTRSAA